VYLLLGISSPFYRLLLGLTNLSHENLISSESMFNGRIVCYNAHNLSATTTQNLISLECINLNIMATKVPTHVPALGVQSVHCRRTSIYGPCMQLIPQNPSALELRRYRECFTYTRPECVKHTLRPINTLRWPDQALYVLSIWMKVNAHIPGAHSCGPSTRPDDRADLFNTGTDVRSSSVKLNVLVQYNT